MSASGRPNLPGFLSDGGAMGAEIAAKDWSQSPLGPIATWPQSLRTALSMMLATRHATFMAWGPELISFYNDAYRPILSERSGFALGMPFAQLWADVWDDISPMVEAAMAGHATLSENMPLRIARDGNAVTYWTFSYSPVRDETGKIAGMFCVTADKTSELRSQQDLRESEGRWRGLFDQTPSFMAMLEGPGHLYRYANPAYLRLVGRTDVLGKSVRESLPELEGQGYFEMLDRVFEDGEVHSADASAVALVRGPGEAPEQRFIDFVFQPIRDREGAVSGIFVEGSDVTDQVLSQEALARSESMLRSVAEAVPGFLWTAGRDGGLDYISPGWTLYSGLPAEASLGSGWANSVHPDDQQRAGETWQRSLQTGEPYEIEFRLRATDGSYQSWLVKASATHDINGAIVRWVGTAIAIEDIVIAREELARSRAALETMVAERTSDLRKEMERRLETEEALRQSQKMEAVGQLTGGIAHDFNNLLQGIVGSLELIEKRVAQGRTGELDRFITGAMASAQRAAGLTHRLLAFSRRQPLAPKIVDANQLVLSMADMLRRTLGERYRVELDLETDPWLSRCDPNQLESAVLNLAINARDAMPDGGTLTIGTDNVTVDAGRSAHLRELQAGEYVCICVTDTGTGMTPEVLARAFDPFFTTKPIGQGTGLGLSMIYGFARQSEGEAEIESAPGEGTTVRLYLPRQADAARPEAPLDLSGETPTARDGEVVLVVEDEAVVRSMIVEVLDDLGYTALQAPDGPTGLALLANGQRVDLLITDIGLPGMDGREVAEAARSARPGIKVMFMTGYAEAAAHAAGFMSDDMQLMTKPFPIDELAARIREMIEGTPHRPRADD